MAVVVIATAAVETAFPGDEVISTLADLRFFHLSNKTVIQFCPPIQKQTDRQTDVQADVQKQAETQG